MKEEIARWKAEEEIAYIHGWDFSHIDGKYEEPVPLPWDYRSIIETYLSPIIRKVCFD